MPTIGRITVVYSDYLDNIRKYQKDRAIVKDRIRRLYEMLETCSNHEDINELEIRKLEGDILDSEIEYARISDIIDGLQAEDAIANDLVAGMQTTGKYDFN